MATEPMTSEAVAWFTAAVAAVVAAAGWRRVASERRRASGEGLRSVVRRGDDDRSRGDVETQGQRYDRLRFAAETADVGLVIVRDDAVVWYNAAAAGLLGESLAADGPAGGWFDAPVRSTIRSAAVREVVADADGETHEVELFAAMDTRRVAASASRGDGFTLLRLIDRRGEDQMREMRRDLIANVSHDLKTPLAAIKGYAETAELAIDDQDAVSGRHFVRQIGKQCARLEALIADMMQLARTQSSRASLVATPFDLSDVVRECVATAGVVADDRGVRLVAPESGPRPMNSDRGAVQAIVGNLIGNAVRYTPAGGEATVTVADPAEGDGPPSWDLIVTDTGVGIAEEHHDRVFERFFRVHPDRTGDGGTGIGLAIVRTVTDSLGGTVTLDSRLGEGSTFRVRLPRELGS